ncbi:MAG: hypothetical protein ACOYXC_11820 [Candidatus Rifleibacteriota bacterium]
MNRKVLIVKKLHDPESNIIKADPAELIGMVWPLTVEAWAFKGEENIAESRLQRNVTNLIRRKS